MSVRLANFVRRFQSKPLQRSSTVAIRARTGSASGSLSGTTIGVRFSTSAYVQS